MAVACTVRKCAAACGAFRLRLGDRALILVQHRQGHGQAQRPLVVAGVAGVPAVARTEMDVGILIGDFKLKRGLAGGVFGQRAAHVGPVQQRLAADFRSGQLAAEIDSAGEGKSHAVQRAQRQTERVGQLHARLGGLAGGVLPRQLRGVQRDAGLRDFITGHRAGGELAFEQPDDVALRRFLPRQQRFSFARGVKIEQRGADAAARLPRGGNKIPARGFGKMLRLGDAFAAFAGGFDGQSKVTGTSQGLKLPGIWLS